MSGTQMNNPKELFLHELGDVLYAEQTLVKTLPKLQEEATDGELGKRLRRSSRKDTPAREEREAGIRGARRARQGREVPRHRRASRRSTTTASPTSRRPQRCSTPSSPARQLAPSTTRSPPTRA